MKVYVAGPMKLGDWDYNFKKAIDAFVKLREMGHTPFIPHGSHYMAPRMPQSTHDYWLAYDFEWLAICDALLRLPGESYGADQEVKFCKERGIPVYYSLEELNAKAT